MEKSTWRFAQVRVMVELSSTKSTYIGDQIPSSGTRRPIESRNPIFRWCFFEAPSVYVKVGVRPDRVFFGIQFGKERVRLDLPSK
ncbi:unnamed protein product [Phytomonas sp. Hart1]|nr:unnamed protein product [Phytomonas sp. Hart1]|eukprot:CCW70405.1 unnamed protein product [Phytomonas sp. isolate Hart1]